MPSTRRRTARTTTFALLAALLLLLLPAGAPAAKRSGLRAVADIALSPTAKARAAQDACANADLLPAAGNLAEVRAAVLCLHNDIRERHGLPELRDNHRLRSAALAHSADMVQRRYFDHTAPGGATMVDRILRARYTSRSEGWVLGENLAWGTGRLGTPRGVVRAWMQSPGHRANILRGSYRELGIGVVTGIPSGSSTGATYTANFGVVRR